MPLAQPEQIFKRGNGYLCQAAQDAQRLPPGHPEAFFEAFANVYDNVAAAIQAGRTTGDFPQVVDGARGVRFIERVVESGRSTRKWVPFRE